MKIISVNVTSVRLSQNTFLLSKGPQNTKNGRDIKDPLDEFRARPREKHEHLQADKVLKIANAILSHSTTSATVSFIFVVLT